MALTAAQFQQQKKQAEELLFSGPQTLGFAKALFYGHFNAHLVFPYPTLSPEQQAETDEAVAKVRRYCEEHIDPAHIDKLADIPRDVIDGLTRLGVLGMTIPKEFGGLGFTQEQYTKVMEVLGGHDSSVAVFVNAHHSIGLRALVLFGTTEQKARWLPDLMSGKKLAAFALTEEQAGSDAGNVQTRAVPTPDGSAYILNGTKRYITNAAIADVLTVMARTPVPGSNDTKVTAFLVTPDMPGFEVVEPRMEKCGIRGTATGRLAFRDMRVPAENVLGQVGKGLRVALTVLDFGRTTFGASCTGAAKFCVKAAVQHANSRVQFNEKLAEFELVKKKIAFMASHAFAMDAMTTQCAAFIDRGAEDYMLETAILKVFATEHLWTIINDTIQLFGGKAYFTDQPFERMMRDARINTIGEGANDVLKSYLIAAVGCRGPGEALKALRDDFLAHPIRTQGRAWRFVRDQAAARLSRPSVPVQHPSLHGAARAVAKATKKLGLTLPWLFVRARTEEAFIANQLTHERLADIAIDLYASACVLSRLDHLLGSGNGKPGANDGEVASGRHFLKLAARRIKQNFAALDDNDDADTVATAQAVLRGS
jgi:alkylation response protein AidB-like acyl-CoA dehydrogenase